MNRRPGHFLRILAFSLLALAAVRSIRAQGPPRAQPPPAKSLRVATRIVPPFVFEQDDRLAGFSIDLWHRIEQRLGTDSRFVVKNSVVDLLDEVRTGRVDAGIAAISITSDREKTLDFTQPMFQSGLQVMVRAESSGGTPGVLHMLFSPALLQLIGIMALMVLVPAHIIWLLERRREDSIVEARSYFPGIFKAIWWSAATLGAQADEMPRSPLGRAVAVIWMFTSILFVAYFTAAVTTALTVQELQGAIKGPDDLPGKRVATTAGSTAAKYLLEKNVRVTQVTRIDDAYHLLRDRTVDAVVFDSPVLLYYTAHEGKGRALVVGPVFREESYGIALPNNSPLRKPINAALLTLRENGTFQELRDKWFGGS